MVLSETYLRTAGEWTSGWSREGGEKVCPNRAEGSLTRTLVYMVGSCKAVYLPWGRETPLNSMLHRRSLDKSGLFIVKTTEAEFYSFRCKMSREERAESEESGN